MRILVAFDKFKGALTAAEACGLAAGELRRRLPDAEIDECPLTDGGEGFAPILTAISGGAMQVAEATGPLGGKIAAHFGLVPWDRIPTAARARLDARGAPRVALVEMAAASGLALVSAERRDPWRATSAGTGELLRAAAGRGAGLLLLGIGGSATNDLGFGALAALGWRFLSGDGAEIHPPIPCRWPEIRRIEGTSPAGFPPLRIACDVSNPLLGSQGAAAIYGPQKGLRPEDLGRLEAETARVARLLCATAGRSEALMKSPGAGAAGGIGFGLGAALDAPLVSGSALIADWLELDRRVRDADIVLTGEGRFDESSLFGKGPGAVVERASALRRPIYVLAGQIQVPETRVPKPVRLQAITPEGIPLAAALRDSGRHLVLSVGRIAQKLAGPS